ncbi:TonB-dependent receptor [Marinigracilibium pacificum]|uniref:TonB-dependent receptor n=1 Tax=Marinigracilibium pacificum TaxID=2729599 RepID=A0A848IRJ9_9BACT|nr:TonB-dependent receptor [Marinigracilibium pacificum]NMM46977.1 TonB-dependent receptor [Marinigracilibium pacificum]
MKKGELFIVLILICFGQTFGQSKHSISGKVVFKEDNSEAISVQVFLENTSFASTTDNNGTFIISNVPTGEYILAAFLPGYKTYRQKVLINSDIKGLKIAIVNLDESLAEVVVSGTRDSDRALTRLQAVDNFGIYEAKKNEVIVLDNVIADKASNNARQVFRGITGINIWESDCAGLQIGVGGRGLSPDRTANFNTRQNGYDIAADALGYPETYYSPALQGVERIEIVRGAAGLQYGPQFGGLVNFVMKEGAKGKPVEFKTQQTYNTLGYYNSFNSIGGTVLNDKLNYYVYNRYTVGDCWRCNSEFESTNTYLRLGYDISTETSIKFDYTNMSYLSQQPGGLTDRQFIEDPKQSNRDRNWFKVNWNLFSLSLDTRIGPQTKLNVRSFGLVASRKALGNLERIDRPDNEGEERSLIDGQFENLGAELRLLQHYDVFGSKSVLLVGGRAYKGTTYQKQGNASTGSDADFSFLNPDSLNSDFIHPGKNLSFFAENVFNITSKLSVTPGIRFEFIRTISEGSYTDKTSNILEPTIREEEKVYERSLWLTGIGLSYKFKDELELYANFAQNYRPVRFSDLRIDNPSVRIDPDMEDETGYNFDIGTRFSIKKKLSGEVTGFLLSYNNKIGAVQRVDTENFRVYRERTNIADALHIGIESYLELKVIDLSGDNGINEGLSIFSNLTFLRARYHSDENKLYDGKQVEFVPEVIFRGGANFAYKGLKSTIQINYVGQQYSDASNAMQTPEAVVGEIPAYYTVDFTTSYNYKKWDFTVGVNNLTNNYYFTRRAVAYPGPGIISADGINMSLTVGITL